MNWMYVDVRYLFLLSRLVASTTCEHEIWKDSVIHSLIHCIHSYIFAFHSNHLHSLLWSCCVTVPTDLSKYTFECRDFRGKHDARVKVCIVNEWMKVTFLLLSRLFASRTGLLSIHPFMYLLFTQIFCTFLFFSRNEVAILSHSSFTHLE